jgi:hypothetical protein
MKTMNRFIIPILTLLGATLVTSCVEYDNYEGPQETLKGKIVDQNGNPLWVESGDGIRIKLMDYGWSDNPSELYLKVKMDGTYENTKVFGSTYDIVAEGPFVPLVRIDEEGNIVSDKTKKGVKVKGTTVVDFEVEPFLKISWVEEPASDDAGMLTVKFTVERGTDDPDFQLDVFDMGLFVSTTQYVGENNYDKERSVKITDTKKATKALGQTVELTTPVALKSGNTYYVRVGARLNYSLFNGFTYNYSDVRKIVVPKIYSENQL